MKAFTCEVLSDLSFNNLTKCARLMVIIVASSFTYEPHSYQAKVRLQVPYVCLPLTAWSRSLC